MEEREVVPVLIIDDDVKLGDLVREYLKREGMHAHLVHDGESGVARAQSGEYQIVVLDVMLPGIGGFEVLRRLRSSSGVGAKLPVLMLTARGDELDRVLGLEMGADDYLSKPFSPRELVARLRAILRRVQNQSSTETGNSKTLRVDDLELDAGARAVKRDGKKIELTGAEFDLLHLLLQNAGKIVTREDISRVALGRELMPFDRAIDVHVSNLRRKIGPGDDGGERLKAIRGVGYLFARGENST
ncbi:transcriptional regulatory protein CpxR [Abditibacteriota bacterium]|nr:transcriptional regulatory protein CpxR [Abditibacteriota bacterium]